MIRLFRFLISGTWHIHIWETIDTVGYSDWSFGEESRRGTKYIQRCTTCGKITYTKT